MSGSAPLVPVVHWAQNGRAIFLKLDAREAQKDTIRIHVAQGQSHLTVDAQTKLEPPTSYHLELDLFAPVLPAPAEVTATCVRLTLAKMVNEEGARDSSSSSWWPRLLADGNKADRQRIKVDWDRWVEEGEDGAQQHQQQKQSPDQALAEEGIDPSKMSREQLAAEWARLQAAHGGSSSSSSATTSSLTPNSFTVSSNPALASIPRGTRLKVSYLLAYNLFLLVSMAFVLFIIVQSIVIAAFTKPDQDGDAHPHAHAPASWVLDAIIRGLGDVHTRIGHFEYTIQFLASFEILHAATGLLGGNARVLPSILLNGGRDIILFGGIMLNTSVQQSCGWVGALYALWCLGDVIRFTMYLCSILSASESNRLVGENWLSPALIDLLTSQHTKKKLTYLRYTLPLILLPCGFLAEIMVLLSARSEASSKFPFGVSLADVYVYYAIVAYAVGAPYLYYAVLQQRRKKLGGGGGRGKKTMSAKSKDNQQSTTTTVPNSTTSKKDQ